jgi:hypothetical protein
MSLEHHPIVPRRPYCASGFGGEPDPRDQVHRDADRFRTGFVGGEFLGVDVKALSFVRHPASPMLEHAARPRPERSLALE